MANTVEVIFNSKDNGVVQTIDSIRNRLPEIERAARPAGEAIDRAFSAGSTGAKRLSTDLDELNRKLEATNRNFRNTVIEQSRLANASSPVTGGFDPLGSVPGQIGAGSATRRAFAGGEQLDYSRAAKQAREHEVQLQRVTQGTNQAAEAGARFNGVTLIGTTVLRQFGVEGSRGIEVVSRQLIMLAEEGKNAKQILEVLNSSKLLGLTFAAAGVLALGEAISYVTGEIRKMNEERLKNAEQAGKVVVLGLTGGSSQTKQDLAKLYELRSDFQKLQSSGRTSEGLDLLRDAGVPLQALERRIQDVQGRAKALGLDTRTPEQIDAEKKYNDAIKEQVKLKQDAFKADIERFNAEDQLRKNELEAQKQLKALRLEAFGASLGAAGQINDIITERARLDAGLGGQGLRDRDAQAFNERQRIIAEIERQRGAGELTGAQQNALLRQLGKLGQSSPLDAINSDAVSRSISIAEKALKGATSVQEKNLALQYGLNATRDIGKLSSSQIEARARFLDQSQAIQMELLKAQLDREKERLAVDKAMIPAMKEFTAALNTGLPISITSDAPAETKVDLGPSLVQSGGGLSNNF